VGVVWKYCVFYGKRAVFWVRPEKNLVGGGGGGGG